MSSEEELAKEATEMTARDWLFWVGSIVAIIHALIAIIEKLFFSGPKLEVLEVTGTFRSSEKVDDWGDNVATGGLAQTGMEISIELINRREPTTINTIIIEPDYDLLEKKELILNNQEVEYPIELSMNDRRTIEGEVSYHEEVIPEDVTSFEAEIIIDTYRKISKSLNIQRRTGFDNDEVLPERG